MSSVSAGTWTWVSLIVATGVMVILLALALAIIILIQRGRGTAGKPGIDLSFLIAEQDGKASLSRFQFLIFTFVIAGLLLALSLESGTMVEVPQSVLYLLGISATGYTVSKGIQKAGDK